MPVNPGTYEAKLVDYATSETKAGAVQVVLKFAVETEEGPQNMVKYLSMKEGKAREFSLRAMNACGFTGTDIMDVAGGPGTGCFDMNKTVEVVCGMETDADGEPVCRIRFINEKGGGFGKRLTPNEASQKLMIDFASEMKALGLKPSKQEEEIPM